MSIRTWRPLSPCHHEHRYSLDGCEPSTPLPANAPRSWPNLYTFDFAADELPALGSVIETLRHPPGFPAGELRPEQWLVVGYDEPYLCTGTNGKTVYHAPRQGQRVFVSPVGMVRRKAAYQRMAARGLRSPEVSLVPFLAELDAEQWTPEAYFAAQHTDHD